MPITAFHALTMTVPPPVGTTFENQSQNWNSSHLVTLNAVGSEIVNAFSNSNGVSFGLNNAGAVTASVAIPSPGIFVSAGAAAQVLTQVIFSNSNNVSFGLAGSTVTASASAKGGLVQFSAGGVITQASVLNFSNANGMSFGLDGSNNLTGSYTVPSPGLASVALSAGTQTSAVTGVTFSNANDVVFGANNGVITASVPIGIAAAQVGTNALTSGTLVLSNSNGLSFGLNNGTVTGSYTVPTQSTQTFSLYASGNTLGASSTTNAGSALSFVGAGVASVGYATNGAVQISVPGGTGTGVGLIAGTATQTTGYVQFSNAGGVSFGLSAGTLTATVNPGPAAGIGSIVVGNSSVTTNGVVFSNSNGLTFGLNGSTITGSYTQPSTAGLISGVSFSAGTQTTLTNSLVFSNSNGLSFGLNNGTITGSYSVPSTQAVVVSANNGSYSASNFYLFEVQSQGVVPYTTVIGGQSGVAFSSPVTSAALTGIAVAAGATVNGLSGVSFSNANGVSFGVNSGGYLTASYTSPSTAGLISAVQVSAGAAVTNASQVVFGNANNVTFGLSGNTITASILPNQLYFSAGTQVNNISGLTLSNSNGISFGLNNGTLTASIGAGLGGAAISAGSQAVNSGTLSFANSNGISFGISNSNQITAAYTVPVISNLLSGVNFSAGAQSTLGSNLVFSNSNGLSFGLNNGTITASYIPGVGATGSFFAGGNTTISSAQSFNFSSLNLVGAGILSVGYSSNSVILSAPNLTNLTLLSAGVSTGGNTAGTTGTVANQIIFAGGSNITLSNATNSNGMTVTINGGAGGTGGVSTAAMFLQGNTTGNSSSSYGLASLPVSFAGLVTGGWSNGSLVISAPTTTAFTNSVYALGNTTNASSGSQPFGSLVISALGGMTAGMSNGTLLLSAPTAAGTGAAGVAVSAGSQSQSSGTLVFSNSNGISFGLSNSSVITASYTVPPLITTAAYYFANNTTGAASSGTVGNQSVFINASGIISAGWSNSSLVFNATAPAQISTAAYYFAGNTNNASSSTAGNQSVFINASGIITGGWSNGSLVLNATAPAQISTAAYYFAGNTTGASSSTAGNQSVQVNASGIITGGWSNGSLVFNASQSAQTQASGNIAGTGLTTATQSGSTLGITNNTAGLNLAIPQWLTTAPGAVTTVAYYYGGNTTGASSSGTYGNQSIFVNGGGIVSAGWSNSSIVISATVPAQTTTYAFQIGGNTTYASSTTYGVSQTQFINASNMITAGYTNGSLVLRATQTPVWFSASGGSSTFQTLNFANSNGVTFSNSAGSLVASVAGTSSVSGYNGIAVSSNGSTYFVGQVLNSRVDFWPPTFSSSAITQQGSASIRYIQVPYPVTFSRVDVPAVFSLASAATTATADMNITSGLVIYSRNGSTLSPITGAFGSTTYTWASNTSNYANLTGGRNVSFPISGSLSAGEYWIGFQLSTTNNSSIGLSTTQLGNTIYMPYGIVDTGDQFGDFGATYSISQNLSSMGLYTATIGATNATLAMSNIIATGPSLQAGNIPMIFRNY